MNKKRRFFLTSTLLVMGIFVVTNISLAAVGLQVGNSSLNLGAAENLYYGNISASSATTSNLLLLQNAGVSKLRIDYYGNLTTPATITAGSFVGPLSGIITAANVSSGAFGSNTGGGNYSFPGNVGIGTTNPVSDLQVGGATFTGAYGSYDNSRVGLLVGNGAGSSGMVSLQVSSTYNDPTTPNYGLVLVNGPSTASYDTWGIMHDGPANASGGLKFAYGAQGSNIHSVVPMVTFQKSGNVGIGTTNPTSKLDVNGSSIFRDNLLFSNVGRITWDSPGLIIRADGTNKLNLGGGSRNTDLTIDTTGNVGIGTTNPGAQLEVSQGLIIGAGLGHDATTPALQIKRSSGQNWSIHADNDDFTIRDATAGANYLTILNASGNVGIGTVSPSTRFHVVGNVGGGGILHLTDSSVESSIAYKINGGTGNVGWVSGNYNNDFFMYSYSLASQVMTLKPSGNVGIGAAAPNDKLSIGLAGSAAPAGSDSTGHNYTNTYTSTDNYALTNYGIVKSLIAAATSTMTAGTNFWGGTKNANIWNGDAGAGNVGIGTTAPSGKLHVIGMSEAFPAVSGTTQVGLITRLQSSTSNGILDIGYGGNGKVWLQSTSIIDLSKTLPLLLNPNGGNIGIGTTNPQKVLDVVSAADNFVTVGARTLGTGQWTGIHFGYREDNVNYRKSAIVFERLDSGFGDGSGSIHILNDGSGTSASADLGDARLSITRTGNVGIGDTTPEAKLEVSSVGAAYPDNVTLLVKDTTGRATLKMHSAGSNDIPTDIFTKIGTKWAWSQTVRGDNEGRIMYFIGANDAGDGWNPAGIVMALTRDGKVGIGTGGPNDKFSIGFGGSAAPAGSDSTGHNYANTYLSTDDYALANYGLVKTLIAGGSGSSVGYWTMSGNNIYSSNSGNVGIGTTNPATKLAVIGDLSGTPLLGQTFNNIKKNASLESADMSGWAGGSISSNYAHSGAYSIRMNAGTSHCNEYTYEDFDAKTNTIYSVSGWIKTITETANSAVFISEGVGAGCSEWNRMVTSGVSGTNDWTQKYIEGWSSQSCSKIRVGFTKQYCDSSGDSYFDDLMVTEGYSPKNFYSRPIVDSLNGNQFILGGNLGIGTANPVSKLEVNSGANYPLSVYSSQRYLINLRNTGDTGGGWWFGDESSGSFFIHENGAGDRLTIQDATGNIGIGTTGPTSKLDVRGHLNVSDSSFSNPGSWGSTIYLDNANHSRILINERSSGTQVSLWAHTGGNARVGATSNHNFHIITNGADRISILNTGNVGIATAGALDKFSIGMGGVAAPAGSDGTGHNNAQTYVGTDNYALANVGYVKSLMSGSYLPLAGGTMTGDVNFGGRNITNLNGLTVSKITATTIDPLYNIKGINYSTFAPSISGGVKEEYAGKASIKRYNSEAREYEYVVDFDLEKEGSDLWVWRQVVDYSDSSVQVIVTPSGKFAAVYYLVRGNQLVLRSDREVEVSYRLIANRYDWREWPTKAKDQSQTGVIIK